MKQLSGQDSAFLEMEAIGLPQHIASVAIYDQSTAPGGMVRFKDILSMLESRLHLSPVFRGKLQRVPMGVDHPYLVDDPDFDLEYHVRHIALPKPGDWRQLCIMLARINARPLDLDRPLWELYVIEGLDNIEGVPKDSFALLNKIHHSVMDGATGALMAAAMHDLQPVGAKAAPSVRVVSRPPSQAEMLGSAYLKTLRSPKRIFDLASKLVGVELEKRKMDEEQKGRSAERRVLTRFNGEISPHRVLDAIVFDFSEIREIKNRLESATINDVMLTIVTGALHKYLGHHNELPEEPLTCGCPIDVRDESNRHSGGNMIGMMGVELATRISDPWERFKAVHEDAKLAKKNAIVSDVQAPSQIQNTVPGGIMSMALRVTSAIGAQVSPFNVILTNVPGPPNQLYFAGAQIVDGFGMGALIPGTGLFHTATSSVMNKQGKVSLSFFACREMLPDPELYAECIRSSFAELKAAAEASGAGNKAKPATKSASKSATKKASKKTARKSTAKTAKSKGSKKTQKKAGAKEGSSAK